MKRVPFLPFWLLSCLLLGTTPSAPTQASAVASASSGSASDAASNSGTSTGTSTGNNTGASSVPSAPPSTSSSAPKADARVDAARAVSASLLEELKASLMKEMGAGGPVAAVKTCTEVAPQIAGRLSRQNGWKVTRVGTRVRNPMLGSPDPWEQQVLRQFEERLARGEKLEGMSFSEEVNEAGARSFRYMQAIGVQPQCVVCHGSAEQISAPVQDMLKTQYPHDKAVGYKAGELRGAVSIKQPLP